MEPFEIVKGVHWIGALHPDLKIFDDLMPTRRGTTYNSYLVRGSGGGTSSDGSRIFNITGGRTALPSYSSIIKACYIIISSFILW